MIASLIVALYLLEIISVQSAVTSLCVAGIMLIIAEVGVVSFGLLFLNGLIALYAAYTIQTGSDLVFGITLGWQVLFGIAFVEFLIIAIVTSVYAWLRSRKTTTGVEGMIGQTASIIDWSGTKGRVRFEGEIWKAVSDREMELGEGDEVRVEAVNKLDLKITA